MTTLPSTAGGIPRIFIITAHSIQKKTSQCLQLLYPDVSKPSTESTSPATPLPVIALVAKSVAASKAITVVEIIKRRMVEQGDHWHQYSALSSVTVEMAQQEGPSKNKRGKRPREDEKTLGRNDTQDKGKRLKEVKERVGQEKDEENDPFEPMEEKAQPIRKKVPLLTIYISKSPLLEFARLYE